MISRLKNTNFIWKYLAFFLLLAAVSILFHKEIYQQIFEREEVCEWLPAGDFLLSVEYANVPVDSVFALTAGSVVTPENKQGMDLIFEELPAGTGVSQFVINVPEEARNVYLSSEYVTVWSLQSLKLIDYDNYFLALLLFLLAVASLLYGSFYYQQKHNIFLLLTGIGILASFPLYGKSFAFSTDFLFHFARINGIYEGMRTGQFPVRINPVQLSGYGYITGTMYPQLFLYFPAILKFFHISTMLGMQLLIFAANLATPLLTYMAVRRICRNDRIAFMAAVLYTLNPYRLIDFYSRGAIGEGLALVFLPLVLWGTFEILWGEREKWWVLTLGMTGVLSSHLLSLEIYAILIIGEMAIWIFSKMKNNFLRRILAMGKATLCTIFLNLYFLGPFLIFARLNPRCFWADFHDDLYTLDLVRAFEPFAKWGDLYQSIEQPAFMSVTLGGVVLGGICLFGGFLLKYKDCGQNELIKQGKRYLVLGSLFFVISLWVVPWEELLQIKWLYDTLGAMQFPWRTLGVSAILFSIVTAVAVTLWENTGQQTSYRYLWPILLCMLLLQCGGYFGDIAHSAELIGKMDAEQSNSTDDLYLCEKMLPGYYYTIDFSHISCDIEEHLSWLNTRNTGPDVTCGEPVTIKWRNYRKRGLNISADVFSPHDFSASMPLCCYPGYHVLVDGEETEAYSLYSFLTCDLTKGTHHIEVSWKAPLMFRICDIISLCCLAVMVLFCMKSCSSRSFTPRFIAKKQNS